MKILPFLLITLSLGGCMNPKEKWYHHMCDSLSRLDYPPRQFDTAQFNAKGNGFEFDTIYPNGIIQNQEAEIDDKYVSYVRHQDSLIWDIFTYDKDAKLLSWRQEFIWGGGVIGYRIDYKKDGSVDQFSPLRGWDYHENGYLEPTYSIQQMIAKLKKEDINLFKGVAISYGAWKYYHADSTVYRKWGWCVGIKVPGDNYPASTVERLYDGQTGELIDTRKGIW